MVLSPEGNVGMGGLALSSVFDLSVLVLVAGAVAFTLARAAMAAGGKREARRTERVLKAESRSRAT
jgi:hypothetical protein